MESALQKAVGPPAQDGFHLFQDAALFGRERRPDPPLLPASQILIHGQQLLDAESRIRRGKEIAGYVVE